MYICTFKIWALAQKGYILHRYKYAHDRALTGNYHPFVSTYLVKLNCLRRRSWQAVGPGRAEGPGHNPYLCEHDRIVVGSLIGVGRYLALRGEFSLCVYSLN